MTPVLPEHLDEVKELFNVASVLGVEELDIARCYVPEGYELVAQAIKMSPKQYIVRLDCNMPDGNTATSLYFSGRHEFYDKAHWRETWKNLAIDVPLVAN